MLAIKDASTNPERPLVKRGGIEGPAVASSKSSIRKKTGDPSLDSETWESDGASPIINGKSPKKTTRKKNPVAQ
jgi:hypothetical protein